MDWFEVAINVPPVELDALTARLTGAGIDGLVIEDEADFNTFLSENHQYWDYVDEELLSEKRGVSRVKLYVSDDDEGEALYKSVLSLLPDCARVTRAPLKSEDWENGYKQFYKPTEVGERLLILPIWEPEPETKRQILRLDPGISFGTGGHATTRLCLQYIEKAVEPNCRVLDLGCGSGILAIAALLLGAKEAVGCDIDPLSKDIAAENAAENGLRPPRCTFIQGDVLSDAGLKAELKRERFGLVLANIVADVIIPLSGFVSDFMAEGAHFICSGIIDGRQDEVASALRKNGFKILDSRREDDWWSFDTTL